jgi:curved DNA-binding protein
MPVQYKDYYATLGVPKSATQDEIRKSFRKLARQHHPDVAKDKKSAETKFKEINEAYEVLGDPEKRQKYDTLGADWERGGARQAPPGWSGAGGGFGEGGVSFGGTGFSDFFEQFFAGGRGRTRAGGFGGFPQEEMRGEDIEADLLVTIEEALHGAKKKISFRRGCSGARRNVPRSAFRKVFERVRRFAWLARESPRTTAAPATCISGCALPGIRIIASKAATLVHELEIPAWKAVLGGEASVPTPDGAVRLKIPHGSQPGRRLRLKGRGLPLGKDARGDFYVQVSVSPPDTLSAEERAAWRRSRRWKVEGGAQATPLF